MRLTDLPRSREVFGKPDSGIIVKEKESHLHAIQASLMQDISGQLHINVRVRSRLGVIDKFSMEHEKRVPNIDRMNDQIDFITRQAKMYYNELKEKGEVNHEM